MASASIKLAFLSSSAADALHAKQELEKRYGTNKPEDADVVVVIGGDGAVLKAFHALLHTPKPVFALRRTSSIGFLCNEWDTENLHERIKTSRSVELHPLCAEAELRNGSKKIAQALNEVAVIRDTPQSAKLRVAIDGTVRLERYSGDGILIATPAGSTAYNHSCGGPIMPLDANTLVVTAICGFRPRRWTYAVLPQSSVITIEALEMEKRPVRLEAGPLCLHNLARVTIALDTDTTFTLLFDPSEHLSERILREQFTV